LLQYYFDQFLNYIYYLGCWDGEPDNRPTIYQVVDLLKAMIKKMDVITENPQLSNEQEFNEPPLSTNNLESQGELSHLIQNFNKMNTKEIDNIAVTNELSSKKDFNRIVDEINDYMIKLTNKRIEWQLLKQHIIDYFNIYNINFQEFYNWLILNNQNNSNSIFLLGYFNFFGIVINVDYKKAFNLFINASEKNHIFAQFFVGNCYQHGNGTIKNEKLAFDYYMKSANNNFKHGQLQIGYFYINGIAVQKDIKMAIYWYEKSASNGNIIAILNLGNCYLNGECVEQNYDKAFELFKQSAEGGHPGGITMLGYCYDKGIGTEIDKQKAYELYQRSANLGRMVAQYNLGVMYENGDGITKDIDKAIYWYEKSAKQGNQGAQSKLISLQ
jgi:TPR repeat protein